MMRLTLVSMSNVSRRRGKQSAAAGRKWNKSVSGQPQTPVCHDLEAPEIQTINQSSLGFMSETKRQAKPPTFTLNVHILRQKRCINQTWHYFADDSGCGTNRVFKNSTDYASARKRKASRAAALCLLLHNHTDLHHLRALLTQKQQPER